MALPGAKRRTIGLVGAPFGFDGAMLVASVFALPAKEIMVASLAITYGQAVELAGGLGLIGQGLTNGGIGFVLLGEWSYLTAFFFLLFYLLYLTCAYTTVAIWKETKSWRTDLLTQATKPPQYRRFRSLRRTIRGLLASSTYLPTRWGAQRALGRVS